jgi:hypothetical protein
MAAPGSELRCGRCWREFPTPWGLCSHWEKHAECAPPIAEIVVPPLRGHPPDDQCFFCGRRFESKAAAAAHARASCPIANSTAGREYLIGRQSALIWRLQQKIQGYRALAARRLAAAERQASAHAVQLALAGRELAAAPSGPAPAEPEPAAGN